MMQVKTAVQKAIAHAKDMFADEHVTLEEVWYDEPAKGWCVTVGLARQDGSPLLGGRTRYHYKTVRLSDDTGDVVSIRNRENLPVSP